ncbi:MAG: aminodeoxychorismate synthase component I [Leptospiraceae bacterium]|nr:aminodeoxychorismate synthase component I [Leptospiraceae bacterium]
MNSNSIWNNANSIFLETNLIKEEDFRNILFLNPVELLIAYTLAEVEIVLKRVEFYTNQGYYLAGYIGYEAGYLFETYFRRIYEKERFNFPLVWFGVYKNPVIQNASAPSAYNFSKKDFSIEKLSFAFSEKIYKKKIETILEHIRCGETYQVNFTFPLHFTVNGDLPSFYNALKFTQKVSYSAIINDGSKMLLSFSPELFFKREKDNILMRPMKGTIQRGNSRLDDEIKIREFKSDSKIKAENSMIVDLIRNDLSKVSEIGSVKVERLLEVEEYETLFQMTSTVKSKLKKKLSYFELFRAIFPGGSITGAPKFKTMQIIRDLESSQRGVYTGAIGFISKDESIFNIAIRTIEIQNNVGKMGIGSGIVWDSIPENEYKECLLKQRFLQNTMHFELIESILLKNGIFYFLNLHLIRLESSASFFGFLFDREKILRSLDFLKLELESEKKISRFKVRLLLSRSGEIHLEHSSITKTKKEVGKIAINHKKIDSENIFQIHKTTNRLFYTTEYKKALDKNLKDYVFLNEKNEIVETSIYNLFIKSNGNYFTPPISSGALPGVMREYLIRKGKIKEKTLTIPDLESAEKIYICNSVRGIMRVIL